jgi:hypothetical protein
LAARAKGKRYTLCSDFDGVLHSYVSPFTESACPDPPVEGAIEWLCEMTEAFEVPILTTRGQYAQTKGIVTEWLLDNDFPEASLARVDVTNVKPAALMYVDDRGWRFEGPGTFPTVDDVYRARPWHKADGGAPRQPLLKARQIAREQQNPDGEVFCDFVPETAVEAMLVQELRRLWRALDA